MTKTAKTKAPTYITHESTISGAISDAFGELESLGEQMREVYDNTPENFQSTDLYEKRGEAADALENMSEPDVDSDLADVPVTWTTRAMSPSQQRKQSRASRRDEATSTLSAVISRLEEIRDYDQPNNDDLAEGEEPEAADWTEAQSQAAESLIDEVQNLIDEADAVEFPGMYG